METKQEQVVSIEFEDQYFVYECVINHIQFLGLNKIYKIELQPSHNRIVFVFNENYIPIKILEKEVLTILIDLFKKIVKNETTQFEFLNTDNETLPYGGIRYSNGSIICKSITQ